MPCHGRNARFFRVFASQWALCRTVLHHNGLVLAFYAPKRCSGSAGPGPLCLKPVIPYRTPLHWGAMQGRRGRGIIRGPDGNLSLSMHFIVKLFPEITIKSSPVRKRLTRQLRENLRRLLRPLDPRIQVERDWEKLEVLLPIDRPDLEPEVTGVLASTPGIAKFARVDVFPLTTLEALSERIAGDWRERIAGKTFCVRVKRSGEHDFSSVEVERRVGAGLVVAGTSAGVRLKDPQVLVPIEIRQDQVFVLQDTHAGLGGFPLGTQDSVVSLISGGFDSTVASYLTIKRGLLTHFLFFNLGGRAHELGVKEVARYLWQRFGASHRVLFITVPFEEVVSEILNKVDSSHMGVVLKRMMIRAANRVAAPLEAGAIVTGESVAQVSSQTLANLGVIDEVSDMLTLRPLAVMDKGDIIDIARAIGTEVFAANMPEYCGVISVKPKTRARRERVIAEEASFDMAVLERALAARGVENIDELLCNEPPQEEAGVPIHATPQPGAVIIDIRHPDEIARQPLRAGSARVVAIPFYSLDRSIADLDPGQQYLLYCDRGVMSRLHGELLYEKGHTNIGVYRPAG